MPPRIVADVYVDGGRNIRVLTTPGRSVQFTGGHAFIVDDRDMPHMFAMGDAKVHPRPESMPWAGEWLSHTQEIKAVVNWPEGWRVRFRNKDTFVIRGPGELNQSQVVSATPTTSKPEETIDLTNRPVWIRPEDLLKEPPDDSGSGTDSSRLGPGAEPPEPDSGSPAAVGTSRRNPASPAVRSRGTKRPRRSKTPDA